MLLTMREHHARIVRCVLHHRHLCGESKPESGSIILSRLRLIGVTRDCSRFISREVLPKLELSSEPAAKEAVARLAADMVVRQDALQAHISRWDAVSISLDWSIYQVAALQILAGVEARIRIEADALAPLLRRQERVNEAERPLHSSFSDTQKGPAIWMYLRSILNDGRPTGMAGE